MHYWEYDESTYTIDEQIHSNRSKAFLLDRRFSSIVSYWVFFARIPTPIATPQMPSTEVDNPSVEMGRMITLAVVHSPIRPSPTSLLFSTNIFYLFCSFADTFRIAPKIEKINCEK